MDIATLQIYGNFSLRRITNCFLNLCKQIRGKLNLTLNKLLWVNLWCCVGDVGLQIEPGQVRDVKERNFVNVQNETTFFCVGAEGAF